MLLRLFFCFVFRRVLWYVYGFAIFAVFDTNRFSWKLYMGLTNLQKSM